MLTNTIRILALSLLLLGACKKFTDVNPDSNLKPPTTFKDCESILDNDWVMNGIGSSGYPYMPEVASDDYYATDEQYKKYSIAEQQVSIWAKKIATGDEFPDWDLPYRVVFYSNQVLETLSKIPSSSDPATWNSLKGRALFFRSFAFFGLSQEFAPAYDSNTAMNDMGIPLRMTADVNEKLQRATVQQTYDQILDDLRTAGSLLQQDPNWLPTRPSLAAVYALTARVYLSQRNYPMALRYADSCLQRKSALMSFDTVSTTAVFPFQRWNPEVIFDAAYVSNGPAATYKSHTDSTLYQSYQPNDLRKTLFFKFGDFFFGRFDQQGYCFAGLCTSDMFLIRSECLARAGNTSGAMADLNRLLQTRWATGTFVPYIATNPTDALLLILKERRKELVFRGTRWTDLRRLNKDTLTAITLTRTINGVTYTLPPDDQRWVFPIPDNVLHFNPGMQQNPR
jgi:hypothetical protein